MTTQGVLTILAVLAAITVAISVTSCRASRRHRRLQAHRQARNLLMNLRQASISPDPYERGRADYWAQSLLNTSRQYGLNLTSLGTSRDTIQNLVRKAVTGGAGGASRADVVSAAYKSMGHVLKPVETAEAELAATASTTTPTGSVDIDVTDDDRPTTSATPALDLDHDNRWRETQDEVNDLLVSALHLKGAHRSSGEILFEVSEQPGSQPLELDPSWSSQPGKKPFLG